MEDEEDAKPAITWLGTLSRRLKAYHHFNFISFLSLVCGFLFLQIIRFKQ